MRSSADRRRRATSACRCSWGVLSRLMISLKCPMSRSLRGEVHQLRDAVAKLTPGVVGHVAWTHEGGRLLRACSVDREQLREDTLLRPGDAIMARLVEGAHPVPDVWLLAPVAAP